MKKVLKLSVAAVLLATTGLASAVALDNDQQKFSYAMGVNLANLLISQGIDEIDPAALAAAMDDVINNKSLQMDIAGMQQAIENQQMKMQARAQQAADAKKKAGADFLAANAKKPGVTALENGLQYEVLKSGDGKQPAATDTVSVHYHGTLTDGTVFDSSVDRGEPASFPLNGVIAGFREAITRMKVGDKWRVYVPSELGYGESGAGRSIGPNETLIFEIDLLAVE